MGNIAIKRMAYALGATVMGLDLARPLDTETMAMLRRAWFEHVLLCFPGRRLDVEQFESFCAQFGDLDDNRRAPQYRYPDHENVQIISNNPVIVGGKQAGGSAKADKWHSDLSVTTRPTTATILMAKDLPDIGGDTMFANTYLSYEALSPRMQAFIEPLWAIHDATLGPSFRRTPPEVQAETRRLNPPVAHPVVRIHPETGRRTLYVGERIRGFVGMTEEESQPLLSFLNRHAVRYEFVYRHRWTVGDLIMWDNRCTMHFAVQDYDTAQLRRMLRCALLGSETGRLATDMERVEVTLAR